MKTNEDFTYKINNRVSLRIDVPQNLKFIGSIEKSLDNRLFEFIEKNDQDPDNWSQFFSISPLMGMSFQGDIISFVHTGLKDNNYIQKMQVLNEDSIVCPKNCQLQKLIITYSINKFTKEKRKALLISLGISDTTSLDGNAVIIQYTRALDKDADEIKEVEKMIDYLKKHHVINWVNN
jgi:hypothetical protein